MAEPASLDAAAPGILHRIITAAEAPRRSGGKDLPFWRERILRSILISGLGLSLLAYIPALRIAFCEGLWDLALVDSCAYLILLIFLRLQKTKFQYRALGFLALIYLVGFFIILRIGIVSGGPAWLFSAAVLAGVLLGLRVALGALALNAVALLGMGWMVSTGYLEPAGGLFQSLERGFAAGANFIFLNAVTALSVATLVEGLENTSRQKERVAQKLTQERGQLIRAKVNLKNEVEERKASEAALRESELRYKLLAENVSDVIWTVDFDFRFTYLSPSVEKLLGYKPEELLDRQAFEFLVPESQDLLVHKTARLAARLKENSDQPFDLQNMEIRMIRKDGGGTWTEIQNSFFLNDQGKVAGIIGVARDITKRKLAEKEREKLETQLMQAEKMKAIGTLAGGVAHDLNNILSGIVSYPELLLLDLPPDSPIAGPIRTIQDSGKKAAAIVQDLLTLARRGVAVSEVVNLNDVIGEYLLSPEHDRLLHFHPLVEIESRLEASLPNILGSPHHLSKTVMNLVSNAAEAMPGGGKIVVATRNQYLDHPITGCERIEEGDYCVLTVSDSGVGIAPEELSKIFEPFFTKKVMGRSGTGLGMAVVWGTVKDHKGYIAVDSTLQKGTTFRLYFPASRRIKPSATASLSLDDYRGSGQTVLVVDDVREQREIASKMLAQLGYQVDSVGSGEEAIEYIQATPRDLIVLDMIMAPGLDGLDTYRQIRRLNPGQKAIITSGFSETGRVREAQHLGAGEYVRKPYSLQAIGLAIRNELSRAQELVCRQ
jgi:PAS domain S-box-containing protein